MVRLSLLFWITSSGLALFVLPAECTAPFKATIDPSELATGARPLGMGRAYVAAADDANSVIQNPAGMSGMRDWQFTSMYSKLIEEVDYNLLTGVYPLSNEAVGAGYVKASVGGSLISGRDPATQRVVPIGGAIGYDSSVLFFSYAVSPIKYFKFPFLKDVSLGASLKIFNQSLTGTPSGDVGASGHDMDFGAQYQAQPWLKFGATVFNALPYSLGGALSWGSGITESIPASCKVGTALKILGKNGLSEIRFAPQELTLSYDSELFFTNNRPGLGHLGIEWLGWDRFALRLGLDQDPAATGAGNVGIVNNLSAGIGLNFAGFRFDYAFHTFGDLSANNTHFFSLSYGPVKQEPFPAVAPLKEYLTIKSPRDNEIFFTPYVMIEGQVLDVKNAKDLKVNGKPANLYPDNTFLSVADLPDLGRNKTEIILFGPTGRIVEKKYLTAVRLPSFPDVPEKHPLRISVGAMAALGYVTGFKDGTFKPEGNITRAEMCTLVMKIKPSEKAPTTRSIFKDVPASHWAANYIAQAVEQKLVKGYPNGGFVPGRGVTRAEAVQIIASYAGLDVSSSVYEKPFPDVGLKHWALKAIAAAKKAMMLEYLKGQNFEPNRMITRIEVVDILNNVGFISNRIDQLFGK